MRMLKTCSTQLLPLAAEHLTSAHQLFCRNRHRLHNDPIVDLWVDVPELFFEDFEAIVQGLTNSQAYVILVGDQIIGFIDTGPASISDATRIGYVIDEAYEGLGIMHQHLSEALTQLPRPVEARIHCDNDRSANLVRRLGFTRLDGSLHDSHYIWHLN